MSGRLVMCFLAAHVLFAGTLYGVAWAVGGDPARERAQLEPYGAVAPPPARRAATKLKQNDRHNQAGG